MAHGGARPNAGRKKSGTNRATKDAIEQAQATGEMPLDFLLRMMRDDGAEEAKRIDCAKAAAPYLHAKLANIEANVTGAITVGEVVFKGLNADG